MRCHDKQLQAYQTFLYQQQQQILMKKQQLEQEQLKAHLHQQQLNTNLLNQIKRIKAATTAVSPLASSTDNHSNQRDQTSNQPKASMLDSITESILNTSKMACVDIETPPPPPSTVLNKDNNAQSQPSILEFTKPLALQMSHVSPSKTLSTYSTTTTNTNNTTNARSIVQAKLNQNNVMIKMNNFQQQQSNHNTNINLYRKIAPIDSSSSLSSTTTRPPIIVTLNSTNNLNFSQPKTYFPSTTTTTTQPKTTSQQPSMTTPTTILLNKNTNEEMKH